VLIITTSFFVSSVAFCKLEACTAAVPTPLAMHLLQKVGKLCGRIVALLLVLLQLWVYQRYCRAEVCLQSCPALLALQQLDQLPLCQD